MDIDQAAARLGIAARELTEVFETPAGWVFVHANGVRYIDCVRFDARGRTGLMFLVPPHPNYKGTFPVFANPPGRRVAEQSDGDEVDVEDVPDVDPRREARRLARLEAEAREAEAEAAQAALDEHRRARAAEVKAMAGSAPKKSGRR